MSAAKYLVNCVLAVSLGACAIHPLPEDFSGYNTETIVRKIRCEARDAVIRKAVVYLQSEHINVDERSLRSLKVNALPGRVKSILEYFAKAGIVYAFTLDGTESDGISFSADTVIPIRNGATTLSPSLGNALMRDNIRAFTITDNFHELVYQVKDSYCDFGPSGPHYQYPITGRIGIDEMIDTFVDLTLFNDLGAGSDVATKAQRGPPTMADTLTFTTMISAGLTPKVTFMPFGSTTNLMDASTAGTVSRTDKHAVIVGLGLPSAPVIKKGLISSFVTAPKAKAGTGEAAAVQAVNQQILRFETPRPLIVAP
jgi:hypothetical protein